MTRVIKDHKGDRRYQAVAFCVFFVLSLVIAKLTLTPVPPGPPLKWDKFYHFIAFFALVSPLAICRIKHVIYGALGGVLFGGAIEVIQPFVGRQASIADFAADVLGVVIGTAFALWLRYQLPKWGMVSNNRQSEQGPNR